MELYLNLWLLDSDWYDSPPSEQISMYSQNNQFVAYQRKYLSGSSDLGNAKSLVFTLNGSIGVENTSIYKPSSRYLFLFYGKPDRMSDGFEDWFIRHAKVILLNNTKWKFHDALSITDGYQWDILFYNNNILYRQISMSSNLLMYVGDTSNVVYTHGTSWIDNESQIIQFPTVLNLTFNASNSTNFINCYSWLIANADMIDPAYIVNSSELTLLANLLRYQFNTSSELSYPKDFYDAAMVPTWKGGKF